MRTAANAILGLFWGVAGAFSEAWGYTMCLVFLPGAKLGLWKLRKGGEPKGSPHMTRRLAVLIQAVALTIEGIAILWAVYQLWRLKV